LRHDVILLGGREIGVTEQILHAAHILRVVYRPERAGGAPEAMQVDRKTERLAGNAFALRCR